MFKKFSVSWELVRESYAILAQDRTLLLFPILSLISATLFLALVLIPVVLGAAVDHDLLKGLQGPLFYPGLFVIYYVLSFIATFFGVCSVHSVKATLEGHAPSLGESLSYAMTKFGSIALWALISATISILFRVIEDMAQRAGWVGKLILGVLVGIFGLAWSVATIFVIQGMVYHDLQPFEAIKDSVGMLKKTWGENLAQSVTLGAAQFVVFIVSLPLAVLLLFAVGDLGVAAVIAACAFLLLFYFGMVLFFSTLKSVFHTVLYAYARDGKVLGGFNPKILEQGFAPVP